MLSELVAAFILLAMCVIVHAGGLAWLLRRLLLRPKKMNHGMFGAVTLLIKVASWLLVFHLVEIAFWAFFFWLGGCLPNLETAFYFSGVTYSTVGYGDVVLPHEWRLLAPLEGLTGILMCGLSTGFFFVIVSRLSDRLSGLPIRDVK